MGGSVVVEVRGDEEEGGVEAVVALLLCGLCELRDSNHVLFVRKFAR